MTFRFINIPYGMTPDGELISVSRAKKTDILYCEFCRVRLIKHITRYRDAIFEHKISTAEGEKKVSQCLYRIINNDKRVPYFRLQQMNLSAELSRYSPHHMRAQSVQGDNRRG